MHVAQGISVHEQLVVIDSLNTCSAHHTLVEQLMDSSASDYISVPFSKSEPTSRRSVIRGSAPRQPIAGGHIVSLGATIQYKPVLAKERAGGPSCRKGG